jgi:hypothetical protein
VRGADLQVGGHRDDVDIARVETQAEGDEEEDVEVVPVLETRGREGGREGKREGGRVNR